MWVNISFALYFVLLLGFGYYFYLKTTSLEDYLLGGRNVNSWVTSLSAQASDMSGWLLMGLPGLAFTTGLNSVWIAVGLAMGTYLNWKLVARPIRILSERYKALTLPEYFVRRFGDSRNILRITSSFFILVFFLIYTSSGLVAGAKLFTSFVDLSYHMALLLTAFIIVAYTFFGGFSAVTWTDFIQGLLMFFAVVAVPGLIIYKYATGTIELSVDLLPENFFSVFKKVDGENMGWIAIVSLLAWGLGYFGQPHILARFMAINHVRNIKKATRIAMIWVLISLIFAVIAGVLGTIYFQSTLDDPEKVFMELIILLFPPILTGVLLAGVLAAIMSTADSQLLVASSSLSEDIYKLFRPEASQKELIFVSRMGVTLVALIAIFLAWNPDSQVLSLVSYAWAGFGATFGPLVLVSIYVNWITRQGAMAGIISGGLVVILWHNLSGGIFDLYEIVPGFIVTLLMTLIVSKRTMKVSE